MSSGGLSIQARLQEFADNDLREYYTSKFGTNIQCSRLRGIHPLDFRRQVQVFHQSCNTPLGQY